MATTRETGLMLTLMKMMPRSKKGHLNCHLAKRKKMTKMKERKMKLKKVKKKAKIYKMARNFKITMILKK